MGGKLTQEDFIKRVENNYGAEFQVLTPYTKSHEKVRVKHVQCGYVWSVDPWSLMRKQIKRCPKCSNKWKRDTDSFKAEVEKLYRGEYEVVGQYLSTNTPVLMRHKLCGCEFLRIPREFKQGVRCPTCRRPNYYETTETFANRLHEKYNGQYALLSDYVNARAKVSVICNKCNIVWECTPDNLMRGHGCPRCTTSRGEDAIEKWLILKGFQYKRQYSIKECRDKRALRFDFAVFNSINEKPELLIEYDGIQHFRPTRFSSKMTNLECEYNLSDSQRKDKIKTDFCCKERIKLLRIHYKDFAKIDEILSCNLRKTIPCQAG